MKKYCSSCDCITDQKLSHKKAVYGSTYVEFICEECLEINSTYVDGYEKTCPKCWWTGSDEIAEYGKDGKWHLLDHISNYSEHSVYSMDCINAKEWRYTVTCPHCGKSWEEWDSNC